MREEVDKKAIEESIQERKYQLEKLVNRVDSLGRRVNFLGY